MSEKNNPNIPQVVAFVDNPVKILWITRSGLQVKEEFVQPPSRDEVLTAQHKENDD